MKTNIIPPIPGFDDDIPRLQLQPESVRDQRVCKRLSDEFETVGCGVDPDTGEVTHVELKLVKRGEP